MIGNRNIARTLSRVQEDIAGKPLPIITLHAQMHNDPFRTLIATILSLRTLDKTTAEASERLFSQATTPEEMLALGERKIQALIYPVGFSNTKAANIIRTCQMLRDEHNSKVPDDIPTLLTFPGVGRKTANLVLIEGFGIPAMCVDTHVHRISNRWGYIATKTPEETERALREKLPRRHWITYNALLVGFGQHRCRPTSPLCSSCPLRSSCPRIGVTTSR